MFAFFLWYFTKLPTLWKKLQLFREVANFMKKMTNKQLYEWFWQLQLFHGCPFSRSRLSVFWRRTTLHPVTNAATLKPVNSFPVCADTGCQSTAVPPSCAYKRKDFIPVASGMIVAGRSDLGVLGAVIMEFSCTGVDNMTLHSLPHTNPSPL